MTWILVSVAIILSIGRYVLRYRKTGHFLWDDGAHTVALATMIALCGVYNDNFWYAHVIDDNALGLGPPLPKDSYIRFLKIQMTVSILFWICIYAVKLSFLLLYRLLFVVSTGSNRAWWSILVFTVLTFWLCIAGELTACGPSKNLFHESEYESGLIPSSFLLFFLEMRFSERLRVHLRENSIDYHCLCRSVMLSASTIAELRRDRIFAIGLNLN